MINHINSPIIHKGRKVPANRPLFERGIMRINMENVFAVENFSPEDAR